MYDLVLLHPPSIYDFRKRSVMYGPISDVIPSTPVFEMYPIGFVFISGYLHRNGYETRIVNIAVKMLQSRRYDAEKEIKKLKPRLAFGVDLHWLPHVQGSLEIAKIVKKYHPDIPIIFGGLSATYFHQELIRYPQVDFVVRGDSTEEPMLQLLQALKDKSNNFSHIPNLTYKQNDGSIRANEISHVPSDLEGIDYEHIIKSVIRHRDLSGYIPFQGWERYPITMVLTCRGCSYSCRSCGGSSRFYRSYCARNKPAFRKAELIAQDIESISQYFRGPIFIIGDIQQAGEEYANSLLNSLKRVKIDNHIVFEFFDMPRAQLLEKIADSVPRFNIQISPESHDEKIRALFGRPYDNQQLERVINDALRLGCQKLDLFFMTGLPEQTSESVLNTVKYCDYLLERFGKDKRLFPFIAPLAPFLDPGSEIFDNPEKFGYRLFCHTLEEHRLALLKPSWKYMLSYETKWMSRDEIIHSSYEAASKLNEVKYKHGLLSPKRFTEIDCRIRQAVRVMQKIDEIMENEELDIRERKLENLKEEMDDLRNSTICDKKQLEWPIRFFKMDLPKRRFRLPLLSFITPRVVKQIFKGL
ncbi:MAG: TIGR04190 family B12-binding domain/radical SAM domain protein [candidate division Zixibacteria bacterium]|nr:TIGR04190 family B12-binding domain/radical SAM domain protein [candidate division Zixibacteria bacterium]